MPVTDVAESFNEFVATLDGETDELMSEFLGYFEATWVGVVHAAWTTTKTSISAQAVERARELKASHGRQTLLEGAGSHLPATNRPQQTEPAHAQDISA